jgi:hypothetical protein
LLENALTVALDPRPSDRTLFARLGPRDHKVDGADKLATILGKEGAANPWEGIENRSVWETVLGERDDNLVID